MRGYCRRRTGCKSHLNWLMHRPVVAHSLHSARIRQATHTACIGRPRFCPHSLRKLDALEGWYLWGDGMSSGRARVVQVTCGVNRVDVAEAVASRRRVLGRLAAVTLAAGALAACAQSSVVSDRSAMRSSISPPRQAALEHHRIIHVARREPVSVVRRHAAVEPETSAGKAPRLSQGSASFSPDGTETA